MLILTILLIFITGLLLLWVFEQHKFLNIFEQLAFGFWVTLSLFVFELFLEWVIFNRLSLIWPILTFFVLIVILIFRNSKNKGLLSEIWTSIKDNFLQIKVSFIALKSWQKIVSVLIVFYVIFKVFIAFSINVSMPTFDEDAVTGWDLKTKIFVENKSLVLDRGSSEFLGNDYDRFPWAWIIDSYFLLLNKNIIGLTNIISPLLYLIGLFLIFGILLRKTNLFNALIFSYFYLSLPFLFIHSFWSYWNYPFWLFLFIFTFYFVDQFIQIKNKNLNIIYLLSLFWFLASGIRNEWFMIFTLIFFILYFYNLYLNWKLKNFKEYINISLVLYIWIFLNKIINSIILKYYPNWSELNMWWSEISISLIPKFFQSLWDKNIISAPFNQAFFHSDYNILYTIFTVYLIYFIFNYKKNIEILPYLILFFILISIFIFFLFVNPALWLLTHFAYVRYTLSLFLIILVLSWLINYKFFNDK